MPGGGGGMVLTAQPPGSGSVEGQPKSAALRFWGTSNALAEDVGTRTRPRRGSRAVPLPERARADDSLRAERLDTDGALKGEVASAAAQCRRRGRPGKGGGGRRLERRAPEGGPGVAPTAAAREGGRRRHEGAKADRVVRVERGQPRTSLSTATARNRRTRWPPCSCTSGRPPDAYLLTERDRADDAVAHRDDFLGMVAHDVRNLLNSSRPQPGAVAAGRRRAGAARRGRPPPPASGGTSRA